MLYGLMTEEINYSYDGGLYAELVRNRTFRANRSAVPYWILVENGDAQAKIQPDQQTGPSEALNYSLRLDITKADPQNASKQQAVDKARKAAEAAGAAVDVAMRTMLRRHGLEEKRDYTMVEAPLPTMRAMLAERKVDLIPVVLPFAVDPELRRIARPLFYNRDVVGVTQLLMWTARQSMLEKNRAAMVDFMEDTLRIARWYLDPANHKEVMEIAGRVTKQPPERFDWAFTERDYYHDANMMPNLDALATNVAMMKDLGFVKSTIDVKKHSDLSIVKEAAARLK